jgi:cathepsin L
MYKAVALLALVAVAIAHPTFQEYKSMYGKSYRSGAEEQLRSFIYQSNLEYIDSVNAEGLSYKLGVNEYADMLHTEFRTLYLARTTDFSHVKPASSSVNVGDLPASIDWRTHNPPVVTPIKNQGQCGSCWAFSTTGSTEGQHALATGNLVSLSEQNLVDCSTAEGNEGCNGGLMTQAFEYIIKNNGIDTEASYPYKAVDGKCKFNAADVGATLSSYYSIPSGSEADLQNATATVGPISIAMDAGLASFQLYTSGVYAPKGCSSTQLDHGVLVVGYGVDGSQDYWIVKNSWGTTWGMEGYFLLARNDNNMCGVATMASYPIV